MAKATEGMIEMKGLEQFTERMAKLSRKLQGRAVRKALRASVNPVLKAVRARVPVRTGLTKKDIKLRTRVQLGKGNIWAAIRASKGKKGRYHITRFIEYGTRRIPARPFMRPVFDTMRSQVTDSFAGLLRAELEKFDRDDG